MFDKLKSFFIVEDPNSPEKSEGQTKDPKGGTSSKSPKTTASDIKVNKPSFNPDNPPKGKIDEKFINRLMGAIDENNIDGFDYLEYKQALMNLGNVEMDEGTKFQSAMAMAKTMGATKEVLLTSAAHYLKVLNTEESKFLEAFKHQIARQVNTRNDEIKSLENGIALKKKQIAELQKEIEAQAKSLEGKKESTNQANAKVEATKDGFYHAYHIVVNQIKNDVNKIKQYLK